jgi:hypothetical protein
MSHGLDAQLTWRQSTTDLTLDGYTQEHIRVTGLECTWPNSGGWHTIVGKCHKTSSKTSIGGTIGDAFDRAGRIARYGVLKTCAKQA